jgi:hypothetical protein
VDELGYLVTGAVLVLFTILIKSWIDKKYPMGIHPINMMVFAVGIALVLVGIIDAIAIGEIPVSVFFIILPIMLGSFMCYGLKHRKEVVGKMRRTYAGLLAGYSYVFIASGLLMFWFAPFMPKIIL